MPPNVLAHIAATPILRIAWKRAGLPMDVFAARPTLGDCTLLELYPLTALKTTTPEGLAFTTFAGRMVAELEARHPEGPLSATAMGARSTLSIGGDGATTDRAPIGAADSRVLEA